jgi:predicted metal-dependent phosphoesterase TrpH
MDVVCITDHNSIAGARKAKALGKDLHGIEVVMGEEVSTADGEVIGLFLQEEIPAKLSAVETIERIRSQDGLVIAPHPFSLHCPCLGEQINTLDVDGIEVLNGGHIDNYANPAAERAAERRVALEVNAFPDRLDLSDEDAYKVYGAGAYYSLGTDAAFPNEMDAWKWATVIARKAFLDRPRVLNARPVGELMRRAWRK